MRILTVFILAILIRFLYFPNNIYFGYDQARDAFAALEILNGDLKLVGPTTAFEGLHHGVLYYYILAPFYGLGKFSPEVTAAALRIFNALGIFLIFYLAKILFNKRVGLLAAFLFAISFEQSQFAIYMGNPSVAVLSMTLMYSGLVMVIWGKKNIGLPFALLGFGASVQFQFALTYLILPLILILLIYRRTFLKLPLKLWVFSFGTLVFSILTFLVAELKYNFPTIHGLLALTQSGSDKSIFNILNTYLFEVGRMLSFNFINDWPINSLVMVILLMVFIWLLKTKEYRPKLIFLGIWFFSLLITFAVNGGVLDPKNNVPLFYPNVGVSIALLIFASFLLLKLFNKSKLATILAVVLILSANLQLVKTQNPNGTISEIDVQQGMLLGDQKKVLDYIYQDANGEAFAVGGITMPLFINTTWSYLFEWYGRQKYGYLPIWNGKNALGYAGNLKVQETQERLPSKRYVIIEPTRGIAPYLIEDYLKEESYFTKVVDQKNIGDFIVQTREKF